MTGSRRRGGPRRHRDGGSGSGGRDRPARRTRRAGSLRCGGGRDESVVAEPLHTRGRGTVVGVAQFGEGGERGVAVGRDVDLRDQLHAERCRPLHPIGDLALGVGAAGRATSRTQQRRERQAVAPDAADLGEPGVDPAGQAPRLVVGEVEVDVAELAPRGEVDQPGHDVRLLPPAGQVEHHDPHVVPWRILDPQPGREAVVEQLGERGETVPESLLRAGDECSRGAGDRQLVAAGE